MMTLVTVHASGVPTGDVTGSIRRRVAGGGALGVTGAPGVASASGFTGAPGVASDPYVGRISKMFVASVQGLPLGVVRGPVALEESALKRKQILIYVTYNSMFI